MSRVEFTNKSTRFIQEIISVGEIVILDYVKRSDEEQNRLFKAKLSKCDGYIKISAHQRGTAVDLYFLKGNQIDMNKEKYEKWHSIWEIKYSGKPILDWDLPHFE